MEKVWKKKMHNQKQKEPLPSIEYIYSKLTYFPEGPTIHKKIKCIGLMKYSNLLRFTTWVELLK